MRMGVFSRRNRRELKREMVICSLGLGLGGGLGIYYSVKTILLHWNI